MNLTQKVIELLIPKKRKEREERDLRNRVDYRMQILERLPNDSSIYPDSFDRFFLEYQGSYHNLNSITKSY